MDRLSGNVILGDLKQEDLPALEMALEDLRRYWERTFGPMKRSRLSIPTT